MNKELITLETVQQNALAIFTGESDALDLLLKQIEAEALSLVPDVSTKKGRDAIVSNAYKVAQAKSRIEKEGKALADKQKEIPKLIDASRKKAKDFLEALQKKVTAQLDDWKEAEAKKEADRIEAERLEAEQVEAERQYQADHELALLLNLKFDVDKQQAEIAAAAQKAKAEQEAKEHAEREAKEQAEREEHIKQQAIADEQAKQKAAIERAEREKQQAEQAAKLAIENARLEKERAEQREKEAIERAEREKQKAIEEDRRKREEETAKQKAIDDAKAADFEHRKQVNNVIKDALLAHGFSSDDAEKIIVLSVNRELGALTVIY